MTETMPLAEVRAQLSRLVDDAVRTHQRIDISRNGIRAAVLLGASDYDALMDTIEVLGDADLVAALGPALAELDAGGGHDLETVAAELRAAGRIPG